MPDFIFIKSLKSRNFYKSDEISIFSENLYEIKKLSLEGPDLSCFLFNVFPKKFLGKNKENVFIIV